MKSKVGTPLVCIDCTWANDPYQIGCIMCGAPLRRTKKAKPSRPPLGRLDPNAQVVHTSPTIRKDPPELMVVRASVRPDANARVDVQADAESTPPSPDEFSTVSVSQLDEEFGRLSDAELINRGAAESNTSTLPDDLKELARAPWTAECMPTDCMMPEEIIKALELCFGVIEGSHKQNYCHAIGQFVRNVFYERFDTEEEYFSKAKKEGEKLGKVLGDILADLFGEEYHCFVNMGDGPSKDVEVLVLMN